MRRRAANNDNLSGKSSFWTEYSNVALKSGVFQKNVKWHMHWVKAFTDFIKGKSLHACGVEEVQRFIIHLSGNSRIQNWQVMTSELCRSC